MGHQPNVAERRWIILAQDGRHVIMGRATPPSEAEVAFHPARVLMPDSSGVPLLIDLAMLRDALAARGLDAQRRRARLRRTGGDDRLPRAGNRALGRCDSRPQHPPGVTASR